MSRGWWLGRPLSLVARLGAAPEPLGAQVPVEFMGVYARLFYETPGGPSRVDRQTQPRAAKPEPPRCRRGRWAKAPRPKRGGQV